ncbi:ABC transporter permease [Candidatus Thorarchaeota archaeon]|nr:MAG: ABC transporter permease [Candidatus Thorarchaeota archaeon]
MAAPRKTTKLKSQGNNAYGLSYALSSLRANPFRAFSLALTLSLGISLFASTMVWGDTGVYVSIYEHLEDNAFQLQIQSDIGSTTILNQAEAYMMQSPFIENSNRVNSTVGILAGWSNETYSVNISHPDTKMYNILGPMYTEGIKDCRTVFVDNDFLDIIERDFWIQGSFELHEGEVLVSSYFIYLAEYILDYTLQLGDTIDLDILMGNDPGVPATLASLGRTTRNDLTIVGIYDLSSTDSMIERAMPSRSRANLAQTNLRYPVLGLRDSIMILQNTVPIESLPENGFFASSSLFRVSSTALAAAGPENIVSNLFSLVFQTQEMYNITWDGADQVWDMQYAVNAYIESLSLSILALPVILLALFFSVFAADTFMAPRTVEVGIIRSKGASYSQVSTVFLWETLIISTMAVVMGVIFSILFAPLIPATTAFMVFDWSVYTYYISNTVLTGGTTLRAIALTVLPSMLFILYLARKAAQTEIGLTLMEAMDDPTEHVESHGFTIGASITLLVIVVLLMYLLPKDPTFYLMELGLGTAAWFFIAYNGSRISRVGLANISKRLSFIMGQKNLISAGYLRMRKGRIIPLMVVLALTMSTTIAFAVQSESLRVDLGREVTYAVGADLRISCTNREFSFNDTLGAVEGVEQVTPVLRTWARLPGQEIQLQALYPSIYAAIGNFDQSSFGEADPVEVLTALAETPNGIILSEHHATFLNKTAGDSITLEMSGVGETQLVSFTIVGVVYSAPGFGYASVTDIPPSAQGAGFGNQVYAASGFAFTNLNFTAETIEAGTTNLFLASLAEDTNQTQLSATLQALPGVYSVTPETFNLKDQSLQTSLFLNTVEGLFSIGFVMSLTLSIFALSISLGSVVRERRKEYAVMRAIGGSKRQIVSMVFSEFTGVVLASLVLSILLGMVFGFIMGFLLNNMMPFSRTLVGTTSIPWNFLSIVLIIELITMVIGAYLPAREASRTEPAVVLRNM